MATSDLPRDIFTWQRQIESRVAQVEKRDAFTNTGISVPAPGTTSLDGSLVIQNLGRETFEGGSILMKDNGGQQWLYAGGFSSTGYGLQLQRTDGSTAMLFSDTDPLNAVPQLIALYDRGGKSLVAEDATGAGAAWPLVPIQFEDLTWAGWPNNTTATFTAVQQAVHYKSSPRIYFAGQAICDGTATGEARLMCGTTQIGATVTLPNLAMTNLGFGTPATLPGAIGDGLTLTLQTRVTSGSGKAYAKALTAMAWPS